jgi:hypothetical protein
MCACRERAGQQWRLDAGSAAAAAEHEWPYWSSRSESAQIAESGAPCDASLTLWTSAPNVPFCTASELLSSRTLRGMTVRSEPGTRRVRQA